jgi:hypothetical protein
VRTRCNTSQSWVKGPRVEEGENRPEQTKTEQTRAELRIMWILGSITHIKKTHEKRNSKKEKFLIGNRFFPWQKSTLWGEQGVPLSQEKLGPSQKSLFLRFSFSMCPAYMCYSTSESQNFDFCPCSFLSGRSESILSLFPPKLLFVSRKKLGPSQKSLCFRFSFSMCSVHMSHTTSESRNFEFRPCLFCFGLFGSVFTLFHNPNFLKTSVNYCTLAAHA